MNVTLKNLYMVLLYVLIILAVVSSVGLVNGIRARILITSSMQLSVYKGSLVLINISVPWDSLEEGNIIVFRSVKTEVMHRVVAVTDDGLIIKPDNGNGESCVTKDMYLGREVIAFPYIGGMLKPVLQRGKVLVIIIAMAMIITGCWRLEREKTQNR